MEITGLSVCSEVTEEHLAGVNELDLRDSEINELREDDFSGLSNLGLLRLEHNFLTQLPVGIFSGLGSLKDLTLCCNSLSELPEGVFSGSLTKEPPIWGILPSFWPKSTRKLLIRGRRSRCRAIIE